MKMGTPSKLNERSFQRLDMCKMNKRFVSVEQLCDLFNSTKFFKVCINTLWKYNGILGFSNYITSQKPIIYVPNLKKRIAWATEQLFWSGYQWNRIILPLSHFIVSNRSSDV